MTSSLIISTYNWPEALELVLLSVQTQKVLPTEVIIADDGSGEETRSLIEKFQKTFPVPLYHEWIEDKGFRKSIVLNKSYARACGDYMIQLDGDSIAHPYFVKDHLDFAKPSTFSQGSRVFLMKEKSSQVLLSKQLKHSFLSSGIVNRLNAMRIPFLRNLITRDEPRINAVRGSNMGFWKADFIKVNGYNEDMTGWGREDSELAARFIHAGVMRRKLKFGGIQFHLYHKEESRHRLNINDEIQEKVINEKMVRCTNGVDKYARRTE